MQFSSISSFSTCLFFYFFTCCRLSLSLAYTHTSRVYSPLHEGKGPMKVDSLTVCNKSYFRSAIFYSEFVTLARNVSLLFFFCLGKFVRRKKKFPSYPEAKEMSRHVTSRTPKLFNGTGCCIYWFSPPKSDVNIDPKEFSINLEAYSVAVYSLS